MWTVGQVMGVIRGELRGGGGEAVGRAGTELVVFLNVYY